MMCETLLIDNKFQAYLCDTFENAFISEKSLINIKFYLCYGIVVGRLIERRGGMKLNYFEKLITSKSARSSSPEFWDKKAHDFLCSFPDIKESRDDFVFDTLQKNDVFKNVSSMVDIGCGIGRHSYYFAENVDSYLGIDSSQGMIDVAIDNKKKYNLDHCEFKNIDWQKCEEKFDLVFAAMCPAIKSVDDVTKVLDMSNRYVAIKRFLDERTELFEKIDIKENHAHINIGYSYGLINIFWQLAYVPQVFTKHVEYEKTFNLNEIINGKKVRLDYLSDDERAEKINRLKEYADSNGNIKSAIKQDYAIILVDKKIRNRRLDINHFLGGSDEENN